MLTLYNTISRKKEKFKPIKGKTVRMYTCGPTVYDYAHIGNLRTYIFEDVLRRTLEANGYKVKQVMNITDVDDKIIKKAISRRKPTADITKPYTKLFFEDLKKLNIEQAEYYPPATAHIKDMINLIKKLVARGFAYQGDDKSIYFNISKFKNYGKLSGLNSRQLKPGIRVSTDEYTKDNAQDFVLWKARKVGEPFWESPWGPGRPGWHIECSAMAMKYLGETIDIHAGAVDLIFPHHENEIAQSEAATGKKFSRYWVHGEHLLVGGEKMSKSLHNIYTLRDLDDKGIEPLAFRYLVLTSHYRSKLNFTWQSVAASQNALNNLYNEIARLNADKKSMLSSQNLEANASRRYVADQYESVYKKNFLEVVNNDLDTPKALAIVWRVIQDDKLSSTTKKQLLFEFDKVLGLGLDKIKTVKIPPKIKKLVAQREKLRINKQFIKADRLRRQIELLGYKLEDTANGPIVSKTLNPKP
jgi:cysteinyl-tRNA synthetase